MNLRHKFPGLTLIELLLIIAAIVILIAILIPFLVECIDAPNHISCAANLRGIGQAIATYAEKYGGHYPTIYQYGPPPPGSTIPDFTATQKWADDPRGYAAFPDYLPDWSGAAIPTGSAATDQNGPFTCNLSCLYLLFRTGDAANPGIFRCPVDSAYERDETSYAESMKRWSFHFITNCSYSFQNQIYDNSAFSHSGGQNTSQNTSDPKMVVVADMNPSRYFDPAHPPPELSAQDISAGVSTWNSPNHKYRGQNCLYGDGHVSFSDTPFCGYGDSNIWTRGSCSATNSAVWSNADPAQTKLIESSGGAAPPNWSAPYGGAPTSGPAAGTGDKYNSFLVP